MGMPFRLTAKCKKHHLVAHGHSQFFADKSPKKKSYTGTGTNPLLSSIGPLGLLGRFAVRDSKSTRKLALLMGGFDDGLL